jgi:hypothetical protein
MESCKKLERNGNVLFEGKHPVLTTRIKEFKNIYQ